MGLFDKIRNGMKRTREVFSGRMEELVENYKEEPAKAAGNLSAKPAKADHQIGFHKNHSLSDQKVGLRILEPFLRLVTHQKAQADGQYAHTTEIHINNN